MAEKKLTLKQRQAIKEYEPKIQEEVANIAKTTGVTLTFKIDWAEAQSLLVSQYPSDHERMPEYVHRHVKGFADCVAKKIVDDMSKEAFAEAASSKTLHFVPKTEADFKTQFGKSAEKPQLVLANGEWQIVISGQEFGSGSADEFAMNIDSLL